MHLVAALVCFVVSIALFYGCVTVLHKDEFKDATSAEQCVFSLCGSDPTCCPIWSGNMCRKGKSTGGKCVAKGDAIPLILGMVGICFLITSIYFVFKRHATSPAMYYF